MNIYLEHPRHGRKIATMEAEAVADEKNGWTRIDIKPTVSVAIPDEMPEFLNSMRPVLSVKRQKHNH